MPLGLRQEIPCLDTLPHATVLFLCTSSRFSLFAVLSASLCVCVCVCVCVFALAQVRALVLAVIVDIRKKILRAAAGRPSSPPCSACGF